MENYYIKFQNIKGIKLSGINKHAFQILQEIHFYQNLLVE